MKEIFQTFKPKSTIIKKHVDYYYLDIKPKNRINEFECFPHFNTTISLYKSHIRLKNGEMKFAQNIKPFQIFTPIRENVLNVKQLGQVYRVVIVFHPLGVQQFYDSLNFADYITGYEFFTQNELKIIFSKTETDTLTTIIDSFLEKRYKEFSNSILEQTIEFVFKKYENFSVEDVSNEVRISRQHLNRLFQANLGVSVKKFHEIVVLRQSISKKLFENPDSSFTELAYEFNFSDQSHFNKSYKKLTKNSPKSFFSKGTILGEEDIFWHLLP